jgi:hypothetical protein
MPTFTYGPLEGQYFTQWRIDELQSLASEVEQRLPAATNFRLWYDPRQDYHHLSFNFNGKLFDIRYYKILGLEIDGVDTQWLCQIHNFYSHGLPSIKKLAYPDTAVAVTT